MKAKKALLILLFMMASIVLPNTISNTAYAAILFPDITEATQTAMTTNSITITWTGTNCTYYEIAYRDQYGTSADFIELGRISSNINSYTINNLTPGHVYNIRIYGGNNERDYKDIFSINQAKTKVTVPNMKQDTWYHYALRASVVWDRQAAADSYDLVWFNGKGKKVSTKNLKGNNTSDMLMNIKNNQVYQCKIRANQIFNGVTYSTDWKTINVYEQAWINQSKTRLTSSKSLKISWTKQIGAVGYEVYVGTSNKSFKKVKTVGKKTNSVTIKKFKGKKLKKKTYYVYVISKSKLNGSINRSGLVYCWKVTGSSCTEGYVNPSVRK